MAYVSGTDRQQPMLFPECVEDYVDGDNPVRAIDLFVDRLELHELGMDCKQLGSVGRDGYDPKALLKLYLYGYLNKIRSSRGLERETKRNIEVIWLLGKLQPRHGTNHDLPARLLSSSSDGGVWKGTSSGSSLAVIEALIGLKVPSSNSSRIDSKAR